LAPVPFWLHAAPSPNEVPSVAARAADCGLRIARFLVLATALEQGLCSPPKRVGLDMRSLMTLTVIFVFPSLTSVFAAGKYGFRRAQSLQEPVVAQVGAELAPSSFAVPECSCDCCTVTNRMPEEMVDPSVFLKCARNEASSQVDETLAKGEDGEPVSLQCPTTCTVKSSNVLIPTSNEGSDYSRYCLYFCQPYDFQVSGPCIPMSQTEKLDGFTRDGNGKDVQIQPESKIITGVTKEPQGPPEPTPEPPCEERNPCVYKRLGEVRAQARDALGQAREQSYGARKSALAWEG